MTIRFAAPPDALAPLVPRQRVRELRRRPANDNGGERPSDAMLHAALRHFAAHGIAAAHLARKQAEAASFTGDQSRYEWWLEICRTLDRRMASALVAGTGAAS